MLTVEDALFHLGYDTAYDTTDANIIKVVEAELKEAEYFLKGAVGNDVFELLPEDKRIDLLLKTYLDDIHDERGTESAKSGNARRHMVDSLELQLKLELAEKREVVS